VASRRLIVSAAGLALVGAYLVGAWASGRLDPFARRPVLDGFAPPPPYRWVSPPPDLAASNEQPASVSATVAFSSDGESEAAAISTPDLQASLFVVGRAFPSRTGARGVAVDVRPRAPRPGGSLPDDVEIDGNVYAFSARYEPNGGPLGGALRRKARVVLVYPSPPPEGRFEHVLLSSPDGRTWRSVPTRVATAQHQAAADVSELGFFAMGRRTLSARGGISQPVRLAVFVLLLLAAAGAAFIGWRRRSPR
jgi:hypothetical protein